MNGQTEKLALDQLDDSTRRAAAGWRSAAYWHWVDAVAWLARRDDELMTLLRAIRLDTRMAMPEGVEHVCRTFLIERIGKQEWRTTEQLLCQAVEDGRLDAKDAGTEGRVTPDYLRQAKSDLDTFLDQSPDPDLSGLKVPSAEVRALASELKAPEVVSPAPADSAAPRSFQRHAKHPPARKMLRKFLVEAKSKGWLDRDGEEYRSMEMMLPDYQARCRRERPTAIKPLEHSAFNKWVGRFVRGEWT